MGSDKQNSGGDGAQEFDFDQAAESTPSKTQHIKSKFSLSGSKKNQQQDDSAAGNQEGGGDGDDDDEVSVEKKKKKKKLA